MFNLRYFASLCVLFFSATLLFNSCLKNEISRKLARKQNDGLYDSIFTDPKAIKSLEQIEQTVELVYCHASYKTYLFSEHRKLQHHEISDSLLQTADDIQFLQKSVLGTATIIYNHNNKVGLLSCAHIFNKPDTILSYHTGDENRSDKFIASISVKQNQKNFTSAKSRIGELEIILSDLENDIAILANKKLLLTPLIWSKVLDYPFGKAKDLNWGTFVLIFGNPNGHKVVTQALVSSPDRDKQGSFTVDSFFNTGLSGAVVLALRDGIPNFEIVGMIHSAAGERKAVLVPDNTRIWAEGETYNDQPIVHYQSEIKQGITYAVSAETIIGLLEENQAYLLENGLDFSHIINRAEKVGAKK